MHRHIAGLIIKFLLLLIAAELTVIFLLLRPESAKYAPKKIHLREKTASEARPAQPSLKGRIAFVIDDWGYNLNNLAVLKQIKYPLTLAILPNLTYSRRVSEEARSLRQETILHLPLEPQEELNLENNTILSSMNEETIRDIIDNDLSDVMYAKGVSNHMGSYVTKDAKTISVIFGELKKRRLFFLDSYVSNGSVCLDIAAKAGIGFIRRDVFLDNNNDPDYIKGQMHKLKLKAKTSGYAVGIGHDRRKTLEILKESMPELEKEGYKFVHLSELVK